LFYINVSRIYDLHFNNFTWEFKIDLENEVDDLYLNESKTLDIFINSEEGLAICLVNKKSLECQVDSIEQDENDSIKLIGRKKGEIKIINEISHEIPLRVELEFISSYYEEYNSDQRFYFEVNAINSSTIPLYSKFYLDIINNNQNEIAVCDYNEKTNKNIKLSCYTQNSISQNSTILLNNNKSNYSSITWIKAIPDNKLEIYIKGTLNVVSVDNLYFNTTIKKWSFIMNLSPNNKNYLENSKIIIDLIYENITDSTATGTCIYKSKKFLCFPDKEKQSFLDSFEISPENKNGTVEFSPKSNLDISVKF
jgi:hypothetical protein